MRLTRNIILFGLSTLFLIISLVSSSANDDSLDFVPSILYCSEPKNNPFHIRGRYQVLMAKNGICILKNSITKNRFDNIDRSAYVFIVEKRTEAKVDFWTGNRSTKLLPNGKKTAPHFSRDYVGNIYHDLRRYDTRVKAVINGQFFNANMNPTFLSFPTKNKGDDVLAGDNDLRLSTGQAIIGYSVGYRGGDVNPFNRIRRTLAGVTYGNYSSFVVFYVPINMTLEDAENRMKIDLGFLYDNIVIFDGGGSTQFRAQTSNGESIHLTSNRTIPMAFVIKEK